MNFGHFTWSSTSFVEDCATGGALIEWLEIYYFRRLVFCSRLQLNFAVNINFVSLVKALLLKRDIALCLLIS